MSFHLNDEETMLVDTVREFVPPNDVVPLARRLLQRWAQKVRQSIPSSVTLEPAENP